MRFYWGLEMIGEVFETSLGRCGNCKGFERGLVVIRKVWNHFSNEGLLGVEVVNMVRNNVMFYWSLEMTGEVLEDVQY